MDYSPLAEHTTGRVFFSAAIATATSNYTYLLYFFVTRFSLLYAHTHTYNNEFALEESLSTELYTKLYNLYNHKEYDIVMYSTIPIM